jgi:hypothetical protein
VKKAALIILVLCGVRGRTQEVEQDTLRPGVSIDSLKEAINDHTMRFGALDERLAGMESDLAKLTKIKISGYIQAQYDMYDYEDDNGPVPGSSTTAPVTNSFYLRRARIKFTYETADGTKFVLQPEYAFDKVSLKDAYVVLNDRWTHTFALYVGQFNKPTYEVEFSSGSREFLERSLMTRVLYPTERDLGAKVEANLETKYQIPLKLQFAILNGNYGLGTSANQVRDIDSNKDVMARAVYSFKFPDKGLGIDVGGHGFFGSTKVLSQTTPEPTVFTDEDNNAFTPDVGDTLKKQWFGGEVQMYYDFLGGMAFKGEYIAGTLSGTTNPVQVNPLFRFDKVRDFNGYYASLIKNIGKSHQACVRFDVFDPNTKLSGNDPEMTAGDLKYSTWTFGWQYFYDENVKVVLGYTMPLNEKSDVVGGDFAKDKSDNIFTIRLQAKF